MKRVTLLVETPPSAARAPSSSRPSAGSSIGSTPIAISIAVSISVSRSSLFYVRDLDLVVRFERHPTHSSPFTAPRAFAAGLCRATTFHESPNSRVGTPVIAKARVRHRSRAVVHPSVSRTRGLIRRISHRPRCHRRSRSASTGGRYIDVDDHVGVDVGSVAAAIASDLDLVPRHRRALRSGINRSLFRGAFVTGVCRATPVGPSQAPRSKSRRTLALALRCSQTRAFE